MIYLNSMNKIRLCFCCKLVAGFRVLVVRGDGVPIKSRIVKSQL